MKNLIKNNKTIAILAVLLILTFSFIGHGFYQAKQAQDFLEAYNIGQSNILIQLVQAVSTCEEIPITVPTEEGLATVNVIATNCLEGNNE